MAEKVTKADYVRTNLTLISKKWKKHPDEAFGVSCEITAQRAAELTGEVWENLTVEQKEERWAAAAEAVLSSLRKEYGDV